MRQPKIDRLAEQRLEDKLNAAIQKALDSLVADVQECLSERETNRSNSTSE